MSYSKILSIIFFCFSIVPEIVPSSTKLTVVTKNNFLAEVIQSKNPVILDIFAPWCQPCLEMTPVLEKLAQEFPNIKFATINAPEESEITEALGVESVPSFVVFYQGKIVTAFVGQKNYNDFKKIIVELLASKLK